MAKKINKGLNMEKVKEIREEVEEVLVNETIEHVNTTNEEIEALEEMNTNELSEEIIEEMEIDNMKNKINNGIKFAILSGKDVESDKK